MKLVITQLGGNIQRAFRQYSKVLSAIEGCRTGKGNKFVHVELEIRIFDEFAA